MPKVHPFAAVASSREVRLMIRSRAGFAAAVIVAAAALTTAAVAATTGVARAATTYPASMAAAGDSITRAYDVAWWGALKDNPAYSWSTGTNSTVHSQYSRLLALNPAISGHAYNDAIATVCTTKFAQSCRWDNYATYNVKFTASDVSTVDYFHPSVAGQAKLAATSWSASYWAP
jgi:hypothetical protein